MRSLAEKLPQSELGVAEKCQASDANANCQLPNCRGEIRSDGNPAMLATVVVNRQPQHYLSWVLKYLMWLTEP